MSDKPVAKVTKLEQLVSDALLGLAGRHAIVRAHTSKGWASITFAGSRHRIELLFDGADGVKDGELFCALLPEYEFSIPGHLVADAAVTHVDHRHEPPRMQVTVELLVIVIDEGNQP